MVITPRPARYAVVTLAGLAVFSLAACGSSSTSSSPTSATSATNGSAPPSAAASPSPTPGGHNGKGDNGKDWVAGLVGAVSGGTVTVTGRQGPATVDITPSTHIAQLSPAALTDITAGECIQVHPAKDSNTAAAVLVSQPTRTQCGHKGGNQGHGVSGTVTSVNGNSIVVTAADNSTTTVTVTPNTRYEKRASADASAITTGVCLAARGTKDSNGVLQAAGATVRPATNGSCGGGRGQH
jgi:hypothetical protein